MKSFKSFLEFIQESKADVLAKRYPDTPVAKLASLVQTKYLDHAVQQHRKGNLEGESDEDIKNTYGNFVKTKRVHNIPDHSSNNFKELKHAVLPNIEKSDSKKEVGMKGRELIHQEDHPDGTSTKIYHVKSKAGAIHHYGHGKTPWCVSATGSENMFSDYGNMYTIHKTEHQKDHNGKVLTDSHGNPHTEEDIHAIHPDNENTYGTHGSVTHSSNDGEEPMYNPDFDANDGETKSELKNKGQLPKPSDYSKSKGITGKHLELITKHHASRVAITPWRDYHEV